MTAIFFFAAWFDLPDDVTARFILAACFDLPDNETARFHLASGLLGDEFWPNDSDGNLICNRAGKVGIASLLGA